MRRAKKQTGMMASFPPPILSEHPPLHRQREDGKLNRYKQRDAGNGEPHIH